jgi:hypothetical protein
MEAVINQKAKINSFTKGGQNVVGSINLTESKKIF